MRCHCRGRGQSPLVICHLSPTSVLTVPPLSVSLSLSLLCHVPVFSSLVSFSIHLSLLVALCLLFVFRLGSMSPCFFRVYMCVCVWCVCVPISVIRFRLCLSFPVSAPLPVFPSLRIFSLSPPLRLCLYLALSLHLCSPPSHSPCPIHVSLSDPSLVQHPSPCPRVFRALSSQPPSPLTLTPVSDT